MNKVAFIIPAFSESTNDEPYEAIALAFKRKGIESIPVNISWKRTTLSDNIDQFLRQYKKVKAKEFYLFGFSLGAYIAFIASAKIKTKAQILCSLSPCFKEDLPYAGKFLMKVLGRHRIADIEKNYSF